MVSDAVTNAKLWTIGKREIEFIGIVVHTTSHDDLWSSDFYSPRIEMQRMFMDSDELEIAYGKS